MIHLIFDWSGTILDSLPSNYETCMRMFDRLGHERISLERFREEMNIPYMGFWNSYFPKLTQEEEERMYVEELSRIKHPDLHAGAREALNRLHSRRHLLSVASSDPTERVMVEAEKGGVIKYFSEIVGWLHDKTPAIKDLHTKWGMKSLYIGDTTGDIEAARRAGIDAIAITGGLHTKKKLMTAKPKHIVDKLSDIEALL